jgi:hypothetical protein
MISLKGHRHLDTAAACTAQGARYAKDIRVSSTAISTRKGEDMQGDEQQASEREERERRKGEVGEIVY